MPLTAAAARTAFVRCWTCPVNATHRMTREGANPIHACDRCTSIWRADAEKSGFTVEEIAVAPASSELTADPEVAACLAVHSAAPVGHCADCGICEDCDVTLGVQETPDQDRCEACANAADDRRGEQNQVWPYTAAGAPHSR